MQGSEEEELTPDDDPQEAAPPGDTLAYATRQQLLDMEELLLVQRFKQALEHLDESGRPRDSDLQLPIYASPQYYKQPLQGNEGGAFDPERLGAAFIVKPPPEGRLGPNTPCTFNLSQDGEPCKALSVPGLTAFGMSVRGKSGPELEGRFYKFVLVLEKPPVDFLVSDPEPAAKNSKLPYVLMHMPKRGGKTRVARPEPDTAVDDVVHTPADAPPTGSLAGAGGGGDPDIAQALESLALQDSCSHCGEESAALKRCSRCKEVSYCGAECQKAGWRGHKNTCAPPLSARDVWEQMQAAYAADDWRGMLKWEGRMEELLALAHQSDGFCERVLKSFLMAHMKMHLKQPGSIKHVLAVIRLGGMRIELLGKLKRFRDQGEAMDVLCPYLLVLDKKEEATRYYKRARAIAEEHGFFSVECLSCMGLAQLASWEGRIEEGLDLLRNALAAAPLSETREGELELLALTELTKALFASNAIDEVEPLVERYREAAKAESQRRGTCPDELTTLYFSARIHEARGKPHEAVMEIRTLLCLLRGMHMPDQSTRVCCLEVIAQASQQLNILNPASGGDKELIMSVAAAAGKLRLQLLMDM